MKKYFFTLGLAIAIALGMTQPAVADTSITVTSSSSSTATSSVDSTTLAHVHGATQLLWWYPNHHINVSMASVKTAPHIVVHYTNCSQQSESIAKQAHGASLVVAMHGSVICNTGKLGHIVGGFKWHVGHPAVLKWNPHLKLYQHVYSIVNGKLVKRCGNRMGGHVDHMYPHVVQVRYKLDLQYVSHVSAHADAHATAVADGSCPDGTHVHAEANGSASAVASATVRYRLRVQATVIGAAQLTLEAQVKAQAEASAKAEAEAKIVIECGGQQIQSPIFVQFREFNDLEVNWTSDHCVTVDFPAGHSGTVFWTAQYGSFATPTKPAQDMVQVCSTYKAPSEVPPGGHDTITVTATDGTTGMSVTQTSAPFVINPTSTPPLRSMIHGTHKAQR